MLSGRGGRHVHLKNIVGNSPVKMNPPSHKNGVMRMNKISIQQLDPPARPSQSDIVSAASQGKSSLRVDGRACSLTHTKTSAQLTYARVRPLHEPASPVLRVGKPVFGASDWSDASDGGITTARYPRRLTESKHNGQSIMASELPTV